MSAAQRPALKRRRTFAAPFVQADDTLRQEHAALTAEGYTLQPFLRVRFDRRAGRVNVAVRWTRPVTAGSTQYVEHQFRLPHAPRNTGPR